MAAATKDRLTRLLSVAPRGEEWARAAREFLGEFPRMDPEAQVEAVRRLAAAGPAGRELLAKLETRALSLPALVEARSVLGADPALVDQLKGWLLLCEGGTDCDAAAFYRLAERERAAVADHLAQWLRADILAGLAEAAPDKSAAKPVRKALHRARSAGAAAAESAGQASNYMLPEREEYLDEAYLTPPDAGGVVFLYLYRTMFGRNTMAMAAVSDLEGILQFETFQLPEPKFHKFLESIRHGRHAVVARADAGFVRGLLRRGEEVARAAGRSQPEAYLSVRRGLGVADEPERPHPVWKHFSADGLRAAQGLVARSAELLENAVFAGWALFPVDEAAFLLRLEEARHSLLELSAAQKREREDRIFEEEAARVLDNFGRATWRERLLLCAYLLYLHGEQEAAEMSAATALAVEDRRTPPLFVELLRRTARQMQRREEPPAPGGLVSL